jgi:SAM-dependent methyltransferase
MLRLSGKIGRNGTRVNADVAGWNDRMYRLHGTPYDRGLTRRIQEARVATVMRLAGVTASDSILELGCEAGRLLDRVPHCRRLVGADISRVALADARALFRERKRPAEFLRLDAQQPLPFSPGEFDVVVCSEMLEHVENPRAVPENIHAAVDRNTRVVLTVPLERPKVAIKSVLARVGLLALLFPGVEPGQSEWHLQAFSRRMLLDLTADLFDLEKGAFVWGCHYAARVTKR